MSNDITLQQVIETFEHAIEEVESVGDLKQYVVAFVSDATPMRTNDDGTVRIYGSRLYSSAFKSEAQAIADGLNEQLTKGVSDSRVAVERSTAWRARRVEVLRGFIADMQARKQQAAPAPKAKRSKTMGALTELELKALKHAHRSAEGNGHDFGIVGDIVRSMHPLKKQAVGALVTSLQSKGFIQVHAAVTTDSGTFVQFTWAIERWKIEKLLGL